MHVKCHIHKKKYTEAQKKSSNEKPRKHLYTRSDTHKCGSTNLAHGTNKRITQVPLREKNSGQ